MSREEKNKNLIKYISAIFHIAKKTTPQLWH